MNLSKNQLANRYDIHVVGHQLSTTVVQELQGLGFQRRNMIGGDPRVFVEYLFTHKIRRRDLSDQIYAKVLAMIERSSDFVGYVEQEVTVDDLQFHGNGKGKNDFKSQLNLSDLQDVKKKYDVHISTSAHRSPEVDRLRHAGFYLQCFDKGEKGPISVVSAQSSNAIVGKRLWSEVVSFLRKSGFVGSAKFEVTIRFHNFGYRLPPFAELLSEG